MAATKALEVVEEVEVVAVFLVEVEEVGLVAAKAATPTLTKVITLYFLQLSTLYVPIFILVIFLT